MSKASLARVGHPSPHGWGKLVVKGLKARARKRVEDPKMQTISRKLVKMIRL